MQQDKRPCEAHRVFVASVRQREKAQYFAYIQDNREDSLCNVYYWAVKSGSVCRGMAKNAQRRHALLETIFSISANATTHCRVDWDFINTKGKKMGPKALLEDAGVVEMLDRPLAVKNIAMEAVMLLEETKRSSQTTWVDSSGASNSIIRVALAPVCEVMRARNRGQESKATERVMKKMLESDSSAESTFLPLGLQQVLRRVDLITASTPAAEWDMALEGVLEATGTRAEDCSAEVEAAVRCEATFGFAQRSNGPARSRYRKMCSDGRICHMTADRCSKLR
jgi:hypothetical protein